MYAVYLLREDLSLTVTGVTQSETIDIIAVAMILLDAGSGESSGNQKG
jgi:hypothetical protein